MYDRCTFIGVRTGAKMKKYHLEYVIHDPSEDTDWMYKAEIPALPGCQAWVKSEEEVVEVLTSVAEEFIASYHDFGDPLPKEVLDSLVEVEERLVIGSAIGSGGERNLITV